MSALAYDADAILERMRVDEESDWHTRLLKDLEDLPLVKEGSLSIQTPDREGLTYSELQVLRCLSHGLTREQTADLLGVSVETVKTHSRAIRYRLRAKTTLHAVAIAIRRGLIP